MKFLAISALSALSLLVGCAAPASETTTDQSELVAHPRIELSSTRDQASVQAKLFTLLDTFKADADLDIARGIESASFMMTGPDAERAISCDESRMEAVAPGGGGFISIPFYGCVLEGFEAVRNGGALPSVVVPHAGPKPFASKLALLLAKGADKGGLGVDRVSSVEPPCCDFQHTETFTISASDATLSCEIVSGGFAGMTHAKCTFLQNDTTGPMPKN